MEGSHTLPPGDGFAIIRLTLAELQSFKLPPEFTVLGIREFTTQGDVWNFPPFESDMRIALKVSHPYLPRGMSGPIIWFSLKEFFHQVKSISLHYGLPDPFPDIELDLHRPHLARVT